MAGRGSDRTGEAGKAGQRLEWIGGVRQARQAGRVWYWPGADRRGRLGVAGLVRDRKGEAGRLGSGMVWTGSAWQVRRGREWFGRFWAAGQVCQGLFG